MVHLKMAHFWKCYYRVFRENFWTFWCHYGVLRKIQYSVVNTWIRTRSAFKIQFWILNLFSRLQKVHFHSKIYKISSKFGNYFSRKWPEIGSKLVRNWLERPMKLDGTFILVRKLENWQLFDWKISPKLTGCAIFVEIGCF